MIFRFEKHTKIRNYAVSKYKCFVKKTTGQERMYTSGAIRG